MVLTAIKTEFGNQSEVHKKSATVSVPSQQTKNPTITVAEGKKPVVVPTEFADNTTKELEATDNASIAHEGNASPVLQARPILELTEDKTMGDNKVIDMDDNSEDFDDEAIAISVSGGNCDEKDAAVNKDYVHDDVAINGVRQRTLVDLEGFKDRVLPPIIQKDTAIIRQAWADAEDSEQPFTVYVSRNQKKKRNHIAKSAGEQYHSCSKGAPPRMTH
jgi:hypothetical protein